MQDPNDQIGRDGNGLDSYTKYPLENAPVTKHGGNDAIQDGIVTEGGTGYQADVTTPGFGE